jgi:hypothetical protein
MLSRRSVLLATVAASAALVAPAFATETKTFDPQSFAAAQKERPKRAVRSATRAVRRLPHS